MHWCSEQPSKVIQDGLCLPRQPGPTPSKTYPSWELEMIPCSSPKSKVQLEGDTEESFQHEMG